MQYIFNSVGELREFVKNDFESSYKILLVEKDNKIIVELNDKQIAIIPYNKVMYDNRPMYGIDTKEIETLSFIFDKSITFEEIANNKDTKEINVMSSVAYVKYLNFKFITFIYKDKYEIEIRPSGVYEINVAEKIPATANHFTEIFNSIDKAIEKIK